MTKNLLSVGKRLVNFVTRSHDDFESLENVKTFIHLDHHVLGEQ